MMQGWQLWGMEDLRKLGKSGVGTAVQFSRGGPCGKRVKCIEMFRNGPNVEDMYLWDMFVCSEDGT